MAFTKKETKTSGGGGGYEETTLERVGYITLDYVAQPGEPNKPVFRGRVYMNDHTWAAVALWKADREGSKLDFNGTLTVNDDKVGYINLLKSKEGGKAKMHGWIKEAGEPEDNPQEYRIFLYQQILKMNGKEIATYNLEGSVNIETSGGEKPPVASRPAVSAVDEGEDYCPF